METNIDDRCQRARSSLGNQHRFAAQIFPLCLAAMMACSRADSPRLADAAPGMRGVDLPVTFSGHAKIAAGRAYLAVANDADATSLHLYLRRDGTEVASVDPLGTGPKYQSISSLQFRADRRGDALWAYDPRQAKLIRYGLNNSPRLLPDATYGVAVEGVPMGTYWLNDTLLMTSGVFKEPSRFYLWSASSPTPRPAGVLPYLVSGTPVFPLQQALQPSVAVHPTKPLVAIAPLFAGTLDVYGVEDGSHTIARTVHSFEPQLRVGMRNGQPQFMQDDATRVGYLSVSATSTRIYALFSGLSRTQAKSGWVPGRIVDVFDWNGQFEKSIPLDRAALEIAVDPSDSELYSVVLEHADRGRLPQLGLRKYAIGQTTVAENVEQKTGGRP